MGTFLLWVLVLALFLAGIAGAVVPGLPGPPFIFLGALIYAVATSFEKVGLGTVVLLGGMAIFAQGVDALAGLYGVKKTGGSRWAVAGAAAGGLLGFFIANLAGALIGMFLGAFLIEILLGKGVKKALRAGGGSLLGILGGAFVKLVLGFAMILIFLARVL